MGPRTPQQRRAAARAQRKVEERAKKRETRGYTSADLARAEAEMRRSTGRIESGLSFRSGRRNGPEKPPSSYRGGPTT